MTAKYQTRGRRNENAGTSYEIPASIAISEGRMSASVTKNVLICIPEHIAKRNAG